MSELNKKIVSFLLNDCGLQGEEISEETALFSSKLLNSLEVVQLINFLEGEFEINVDPFDVSLEQFDSVKLISEYVISNKNN